VKPSILRIGDIKRGKLLHLPSHLLGFFPLMGFLESVVGTSQPDVSWIGFPSFSLGIGWDEDRFHKGIGFTEIDVGEYRTQEGALCEVSNYAKVSLEDPINPENALDFLRIII
jgi:hypothetical protein